MKSRISILFAVAACLLLSVSLRALGQTAAPTGSETAVTAPAPQTDATAPAPMETAPVGNAAAAPAEASTAPAPEQAAATAPSEPAAAAPETVTTAPATGEIPAVAESVAGTMPATETPAVTPLAGGTTEAAAPGGATATTSTAEVIELTPEQQNVTGAEITTNPKDENKISVTLDNVPLQDVIRMFTRISGANIVSGTNLVGNVTVNLQDVEWEPALKVILDVVDMALVEKSDGIYAVIPKSELASEPVVSDTVFLNYSTVSNILPVIQKLLSSTNASAAGFPSANAIVIQETRPRLNLIREAIKMIDRPRAQVLIEAKFVELNDQAIKDLGINWQSLQGYTVHVGAPSFSYNKTRTDKEGYDDEATYRTVKQDAFATGSNSGSSTADHSGQSSSRDAASGTTSSSQQQQDSTPSVSESSGSTASGSANASGASDNSHNSDSFNAVGTIAVAGENFSDVDFAGNTIKQVPRLDDTRLVTDSLMNETVTAIGAVLSGDEFALTLSALKQNSGVEVVSNPKIVVASGENATIHVGTRIPNYETKNQAGAGNTVTTSRELSESTPFIETGVILDVQPTVNTESNITVKITPELSRTLPTTGGFPGDIPPIQTRKIISQFNLESGRTVAIGGLTQTDEREQVSKVPFLGDIPIIGKYLFRHTHTEKSQDEVIIFVTVAIANPSTLVQSSGIPEDGKLIYRHLARKVEESARAAEDAKSSKSKKPDWISSKH